VELRPRVRGEGDEGGLCLQGGPAGKEEDTDRFYAYERSYGSFSRSFTLPEGVDGEHRNAELKDGVLNLRLPKVPEVQPRRIQVGSTENKQGQVKA
jgi:HSP20 family protein